MTSLLTNLLPQRKERYRTCLAGMKLQPLDENRK